MKVKVKVQEKIFDVEISDLGERPIIAVVDGETFEIWPETERSHQTDKRDVYRESKAEPTTSKPVVSKTIALESQPVAPVAQTAEAAAEKRRVVRAPIPGVITAIAVQPGSNVVVGQELCKLEAMKMNNSVRASRAGKISALHISIGQQVKHGDPLIEYAD